MKKTLFTDSTSIFSVVEVLDEALMTAEKSRVVYRLDRQKLSGSASLSSEGGTAVDVLRSIPSEISEHSTFPHLLLQRRRPA